MFTSTSTFTCELWRRPEFGSVFVRDRLLVPTKGRGTCCERRWVWRILRLDYANGFRVCCLMKAAALCDIFTTLHAMQTRSNDENSVCLSLCPSVKRVIYDKTKEWWVQIFTPYKRSLSLVFWKEEWLVGATPSTWNFGSTGPPAPVGAKSSNFSRYSFAAPQR